MAATLTTTAVAGTVVVDPPQIAAGLRGTVTVSIPGISQGDFFRLEFPGDLSSSLVYEGFRIGTGQVIILLHNISSSTYDDTPNTWSYFWIDTTPSNDAGQSIT